VRFLPLGGKNCIIDDRLRASFHSIRTSQRDLPAALPAIGHAFRFKSRGWTCPQSPIPLPLSKLSQVLRVSSRCAAWSKA